MSTYTTKQGDMWDQIALSQYGAVSAMVPLMMANTQHIGTYIFPAGVTLELPEIDDGNPAMAVLPPWKQEDGV